MTHIRTEQRRMGRAGYVPAPRGYWLTQDQAAQVIAWGHDNRAAADRMAQGEQE